MPAFDAVLRGSYTSPAIMLSREEEYRLRTTLETLPNAVEIDFRPAPGSEFSRSLESFLKMSGHLSEGRVRVVETPDGADLPVVPSFRLHRPGRAGIHFAALPAGHQLVPFLKALELVAGDSSPKACHELDPNVSATELQVFIAAQCPRCPAVVETALFAWRRFAPEPFLIMDAAQFPDLTLRYGIKAVPAIVLDRRLVLTGAIAPDWLTELITIRGTPRFEAEVTRSMVATGRIQEAAAGLCREAGREAILGLLQESDMSSRMGALVVMERALTEQPDAVRAMTPHLICLLSHPDARIRGDIADLLGRTGDWRAIARLELLATDPDPDVAEAAVEAIEAIRSRHA